MFFHIESGRERQHNFEPLSVRGKAVMIVGGATEIGRATASLLAGRGARVFVTANNSTELRAVLKEVCQLGDEVHGMVVHFDHPEDIRQVFDEAERRLGGIDILVNHLGDADICLDAQNCQDWCTEEGIAHMQARGKGHIINIGLPVSGQAAAASKIPVTGASSLLTSITSALRRQASELGIRMTTIESGVGSGREPAVGEASLLPEDIARCVYDSIIQPFPVDLVLVRGRVQSLKN